MNSLKKLTFASLLSLVSIGGLIGWLGSNTHAGAATASEKLTKPVGFEQKAYDLNPAPILKGNEGQKDKLATKKDKILSHVKLEKNDKISSAVYKTWKDYATTQGNNVKNFEVDDNRLVLVIQIDCPDGVQTRGGYFKNATRTYVVDAETENVIEMRVHGEPDPSTGPFNNPINSVDKN